MSIESNELIGLLGTNEIRGSGLAAKGEKGDPGPQGEPGPQGNPGPANILTIGTVQGGETADASITGDSPNQVLNLTLPKGDKGDTGEKGDPGTTDYNELINKPTIPTKTSDLTNDSGFITDISDKEDKSNKVTEISSSSTNEQYPSAKSVYDNIEEHGVIISPTEPTDRKKVWLQKNIKNLVNMYREQIELNKGKYHMSGSERVNNAYTYIKIPVISGKKLVYSGANNASSTNVIILEQYNNDTYIGQIYLGTTTGETTLANNCNYLYFSFPYNDINTIQLEYGEQPTSLETFVPKKLYVLNNNNEYEEFTDTVHAGTEPNGAKVWIKYPKDMFDTFMERGTFLNNGLNNSSTNRIRTNGYIKVKPNTEYKILIKGNSAKILQTSISFYTTNDYTTPRTDFIGWEHGNIRTFVTPNNCEYVRFLIAFSDDTDILVTDVSNVKFKLATAVSINIEENGVYEEIYDDDYKKYEVTNLPAHSVGTNTYSLTKRRGTVIFNLDVIWLNSITANTWVYLGNIPSEIRPKHVVSSTGGIGSSGGDVLGSGKINIETDGTVRIKGTVTRNDVSAVGPCTLSWFI